MATYDDVGSAEAIATLAEAQAIGVSVSLTHRETAAVTLSALILKQGLSEERIRGVLREIGILVLRIPVQTGFAVMTDNARPITEGDQLEYPLDSGRYFFVKSEEDIEQGSNGYDFLVKFIEKKSLTFGARS